MAINNVHVTTRDDIYPGGYEIPKGKLELAFRMVKIGDTFISPKREVCTLRADDVSPSGPRVVLKDDPAYVPSHAFRTIYNPEYTRQTKPDVKPPQPSKAPEGYCFTGEFRPAGLGDYLLWSKTEVHTWCLVHKSSKCYWILKPTAPPATQPSRPAQAPKGYYFTREFRQVKRDEEFVWPEGGIALWNLPGQTLTSYWIIKPIPPAPVIPGWEAKEFREVKPGDQYIGQFNKELLAASCSNSMYKDFYAWIYTKLPTQPPPPTVESIYGTKIPVAPEGWVLGEFKQITGATPAWLGNDGRLYENLISVRDHWRYTLLPAPHKPKRYILEVEEGSYKAARIGDSPYLYEVRAPGVINNKAFLAILSVTPKQ